MTVTVPLVVPVLLVSATVGVLAWLLARAAFDRLTPFVHRWIVGRCVGDMRAIGVPEAEARMRCWAIVNGDEE